MDTTATTDIISCDLEPIHIPGSIQPNGAMLIADRNGEIVGAGGSAEHILGQSVSGRSLLEVLGTDVASKAMTAVQGRSVVIGPVRCETGVHDTVTFRSGGHVVVELFKVGTGATNTASLLADLDGIVSDFERSGSLTALYGLAADTFRSLTGYSRVMIYQFLDDDAGVVVGESLGADTASFMNHHFPASDIPKQARALYIRNKTRVIPDVGYDPQPIRSFSGDLRELDLSDSSLRSVSPIHIQYLKNMGVAASASVSIVKDGVLWGLVACHHHEPLDIALDVRMACQALAGSLSRMIRSKESADLLKERLRLRAQEETILSKMGPDTSLEDFFSQSGGELAKLLNADSFAAAQGGEIFVSGKHPDRSTCGRSPNSCGIPQPCRLWRRTVCPRRCHRPPPMRTLPAGCLRSPCPRKCLPS